MIRTTAAEEAPPKKRAKGNAPKPAKKAKPAAKAAPARKTQSKAKEAAPSPKRQSKPQPAPKETGKRAKAKAPEQEKHTVDQIFDTAVDTGPSQGAVQEIVKPVSVNLGMARPRSVTFAKVANEGVSALARRMTEARNRKGVSQSVVAVHIGVSRPAYGQWELGITAPSLPKVMDIARFLGVDPAWLAFGINSNKVLEKFEDLHMTPVPEIAHRPDGTEVTIATWGIPEGKLTQLGLNPGEVKVIMVPHGAAGAGLQHGDQVLVDTSVKQVNIPALYAFVGPNGIDIAAMRAVLGGKIMLGVASVEPMEIDIIGRVVAPVLGKLQH